MDEAIRVISYLRQAGKTLATAESCTGGLLGKLLTDVPGSSAVYPGGVISYCNEVKHAVLGVDAELLEREGAVCAPVAAQMAESVRRLLNADYGISTTGVAGPGGDERGNPEGLVYAAIAEKEGTKVLELHLSGTREEIREAAAKALFSESLRVMGVRP
ncbi:MAG: CinA family protein [Ruminococcaceae bacterium]|nr:CinA family protein [Oscillospiraceae bacterium]